MGEDKSLTPSHGTSQLDIGKVSSEPLHELLETWQYHAPGKVLKAVVQCEKIDEHDMRIIRHLIGRWRRSAEHDDENLTIKVGGEYHGSWLCGDQRVTYLSRLRDFYNLGAKNAATRRCPTCDENVVPGRRLIDVSKRPDDFELSQGVRNIQEAYCMFCGEVLEPAPVVEGDHEV